MSKYSRRDFIRTTLTGSAAMLASARWATAATLPESAATATMRSASSTNKTRVSLTTGNERADITFNALKPFAKEVATAIGNRQVIVKPNNVVAGASLACTDAENLEGIL